MLIILDGPEKAGKTTLARELRAGSGDYRGGLATRHWGPIPARLPGTDDFGDTAYRAGLRIDLGDPMAYELSASALAAVVEYGSIADEQPTLDPLGMVWDRSWASEVVYAGVLGRTDRRLYGDPWLAEWLYGRAVQASGIRVMVLGPSAGRLAELRSSDDLPVKPELERALFHQYATEYGWEVVQDNHVDDKMHRMIAAGLLVKALRAQVRANQLGAKPPDYAGPPDAPVLVVGERRNGNDPGWLPFATPYTTRFARCLGSDALRCGWTNADVLAENPHWVTEQPRRLVVACGRVAEAVVEHLEGYRDLLCVEHPAALYRWDRMSSRIEGTESATKRAVTHALAG